MSEKTHSLPQHIAIIMDGNGRWAKHRGLPRSAGHFAGAKNISRIVNAAIKEGVRYLTVYAFSTENWNRPQPEVKYLMRLIPHFMTRLLKSAMQSNVRIRAIGRLNGLPEYAQEAIRKVSEETAGNSAFTFTIALNYGGRPEIVDAVNALLEDKTRAPGKVTAEEFARYLYAPDTPDPDLMIRTGGEMRLSNFLLWELSYAELYVTDVLWPDFSAEDLSKAIDAFMGRERRFGAIQETSEKK